MTAQSPIPLPTGADTDAQGSFAMVTAADLDPVCRSGAIGAFLSRRLEQRIRWGHSPADDLRHPVDHLPREAMARLVHVLEELGRGRGDAPADRRDIVLRKIEIAGALLMAAHDRISAQSDEQETA